MYVWAQTHAHTHTHTLTRAHRLLSYWEPFEAECYWCYWERCRDDGRLKRCVDDGYSTRRLDHFSQCFRSPQCVLGINNSTELLKTEADEVLMTYKASLNKRWCFKKITAGEKNNPDSYMAWAKLSSHFFPLSCASSMELDIYNWGTCCPTQNQWTSFSSHHVAECALAPSFSLSTSPSSQSFVAIIKNTTISEIPRESLTKWSAKVWNVTNK